MKNILILLDHYLPMASANGICCENIAGSLIENGYNVNIVAYAYDDKRYEEINGACVYYTEYVKKPSAGALSKLAFYTKWLLCPSRYPITEIKERTWAIIETASRVIEEKSIDTLICVHLPIETLIAGVRLKEKYPEINCVSYMLDSLSGGFVPRLLPGKFCRARKIKWENNLQKSFDFTVLMESCRNQYDAVFSASTWYKNAVFGDIPLFKAKEQKETDLADSSKAYTMSYVGTMGDGVRTPYYFLKLLGLIEAPNISFAYAGKNNCDENTFASAMENVKEKDNVTVTALGMLSHSEALSVVEGAEILVNFGNVVPTMVPSKIFEYMSYGKPIISTYSIDSEPCLPYLRKYPCVLLIDERDMDIEKKARELEDFISTNRNAKVDVKGIEDIFYANTPQAFVKALRERFGENS